MGYWDIRILGHLDTRASGLEIVNLFSFYFFFFFFFSFYFFSLLIFITILIIASELQISSLSLSLYLSHIPLLLLLLLLLLLFSLPTRINVVVSLFLSLSPPSLHFFPNLILVAHVVYKVLVHTHLADYETYKLAVLLLSRYDFARISWGV